MKNIFILLSTIFILLSCSTDDNRNTIRYEVIKIESFIVPATFVSGDSYQISVKYKRPTTCHYFNNLYFQKDASTRKIAIETLVEERDNCLPLTENNPEIEYTFNFQVIQAAGTQYLFKFYKGKNANGDNIFEDITIPVTD
jgi:hypothetical protein